MQNRGRDSIEHSDQGCVTLIPHIILMKSHSFCDILRYFKDITCVSTLITLTHQVLKVTYSSGVEGHPRSSRCYWYHCCHQNHSVQGQTGAGGGAVCGWKAWMILPHQTVWVWRGIGGKTSLYWQRMHLLTDLQMAHQLSQLCTLFQCLKLVNI